MTEHDETIANTNTNTTDPRIAPFLIQDVLRHSQLAIHPLHLLPLGRLGMTPPPYHLHRPRDPLRIIDHMSLVGYDQPLRPVDLSGDGAPHPRTTAIGGPPLAGRTMAGVHLKGMAGVGDPPSGIIPRVGCHQSQAT